MIPPLCVRGEAARADAMGVAAVLFGAAFFLATVFTLIAILGAPQCPV